MKAHNNKRYWIPHVGSMPHETSPSGLTYLIQMRVPEKDQPANGGHEYVALTGFTLDYPEAMRWLHAHREKAGRHLWSTKNDPPLIGN